MEARSVSFGRTGDRSDITAKHRVTLLFPDVDLFRVYLILRGAVVPLLFFLNYRALQTQA